MRTPWYLPSALVGLPGGYVRVSLGTGFQQLRNVPYGVLGLTPFGDALPEDVSVVASTRGRRVTTPCTVIFWVEGKAYRELLSSVTDCAVLEVLRHIVSRRYAHCSPWRLTKLFREEGRST